MQRTRKNSRMEIWNTGYINRQFTREPEDEDVLILQIEPAVDPNNYIVEIIDREKVEYLA